MQQSSAISGARFGANCHANCPAIWRQAGYAQKVLKAFETLLYRSLACSQRKQTCRNNAVARQGKRLKANILYGQQRRASTERTAWRVSCKGAELVTAGLPTSETDRFPRLCLAG